ncbi:tetratricopeptide repeat protein [Acinetobacter sp. c2-A9]|uniref:tetratricopeptide repeat protein n=1 Tax=Acinetobacter sp. c2-A9 TaxID=3342802 RepID=UPI0035BA4E98
MKKLVLSLFLATAAVSAHADLINNQPQVQHPNLQFANMPLDQLTAAAQAGQAPAQFFLGNRYKHGQGVAVDQAQAFTWFKRAADQGIPAAQLNVGQMYAKGVGVRKNMAAAKDYFMKAAKLGDNRASYNLALIEESAKNYASAYQWYELSTRDGMLDFRVKDLSKQKIVQLAANLDNNTMIAARERADRWIQAD